MGVREIQLNEVIQDRPDTSYLATGIKENLVEIMRGVKLPNSGFVWNQGVISYYDLDGTITLSGLSLLQNLYQRQIVNLPTGLTQFWAKLFCSVSTQDPDIGFQIHLYNRTTLVNYIFTITNLDLVDEAVVELICGGLTGGALYRVQVYALRNSTGAPIASYTLRQFTLRQYPSI